MNLNHNNATLCKIYTAKILNDFSKNRDISRTVLEFYSKFIPHNVLNEENDNISKELIQNINATIEEIKDRYKRLVGKDPKTTNVANTYQMFTKHVQKKLTDAIPTIINSAKNKSQIDNYISHIENLSHIENPKFVGVNAKALKDDLEDDKTLNDEQKKEILKKIEDKLKEIESRRQSAEITPQNKTNSTVTNSQSKNTTTSSSTSQPSSLFKNIFTTPQQEKAIKSYSSHIEKSDFDASFADALKSEVEESEILSDEQKNKILEKINSKLKEIESPKQQDNSSQSKSSSVEDDEGHVDLDSIFPEASINKNFQKQKTSFQNFYESKNVKDLMSQTAIQIVQNPDDLESILNEFIEKTFKYKIVLTEAENKFQFGRPALFGPEATQEKELTNFGTKVIQNLFNLKKQKLESMSSKYLKRKYEILINNVIDLVKKELNKSFISTIRDFETKAIKADDNPLSEKSLKYKLTIAANRMKNLIMIFKDLGFSNPDATLNTIMKAAMAKDYASLQKYSKKLNEKLKEPKFVHNKKLIDDFIKGYMTDLKPDDISNAILKGASLGIPQQDIVTVGKGLGVAALLAVGGISNYAREKWPTIQSYLQKLGTFFKGGIDPSVYGASQPIGMPAEKASAAPAGTPQAPQAPQSGEKSSWFGNWLGKKKQNTDVSTVTNLPSVERPQTQGTSPKIINVPPETEQQKSQKTATSPTSGRSWFDFLRRKKQPAASTQSRPRVKPTGGKFAVHGDESGIDL